MENFIYYAPTKVYFGKGQEINIGTILKEYNPKKVLVHFGGKSAENSGLLQRVLTNLDENHIEYICLGGVVPNPELSLVRKGISLCMSEHVDFVLAIGGGSVIDSAKAIALGVANPSLDIWDIITGKVTPVSSLGKGAILTISAAGSEMSNSDVITNELTHEKRGLGSVLNRLDFAIENPELTYSVSKYQTACGIVDIGMHTIERYFDIGDGTSLTDSIAEALIKNVFEMGLVAYNEPDNYDARANLMWASSLAHNGLTHCGRKFMLAVHKLEHEVSGMYPEVAHGAGLAALWCSWARYVYKYNMDRWIQYSKNIWGIDVNPINPDPDILKAIKMQEDYYKQIGMPTSLYELNVKEDSLYELALKCSLNKERIIDGYRPLAFDDIYEIFKMSYPKK